jgi:transcriptional repressor NrdR
MCRSLDTRVLDKRDSADASTTRRRRQCHACLARFTTYERPELAVLMVVKSDRRRQEFDREKLRRSLQVACTKRPISAETIERMVEQIESELRARDQAEVPSSVIGDLAMAKLRQLDQVAYIRFASVYRAFADVSSFEDELRQLLDRGGQPRARDRMTPSPTPGSSGTPPSPSASSSSARR